MLELEQLPKEWSQYQSSRSVWTMPSGTGWNFGIVQELHSVIPAIPFQLRVFHEQLQVVPGAASTEKPSRPQPPLGCGHTLGQGKPLLPLEKPMAQPRSAIRDTKSRKITWFHSFLHVWTRMFLGCVDSPEVPQLLTATQQQRFISAP